MTKKVCYIVMHYATMRTIGVFLEKRWADNFATKMTERQSWTQRKLLGQFYFTRKSSLFVR